MKKILTLLIAASAFVTLHAQSREQTREVILGGSKDNGGYGNPDRDVILGGGSNRGQYPAYPNNGSYGNNRQYQIDQVNRDYDAKIYSIRNNRYLSNAEKERMIRQLERDRQQQVDNINRNYNSNYGRYDNGRYDNDRNDRYDNGKHRGWNKKNKNKNWKNGQSRNWDDD